MGSLIVKAEKEGDLEWVGGKAKLLPSPRGPWGFWECAVGSWWQVVVIDIMGASRQEWARWLGRRGGVGVGARRRLTGGPGRGVGQGSGVSRRGQGTGSGLARSGGRSECHWAMGRRGLASMSAQCRSPAPPAAAPTATLPMASFLPSLS